MTAVDAIVLFVLCPALLGVWLFVELRIHRLRRKLGRERDAERRARTARRGYRDTGDRT